VDGYLRSAGSITWDTVDSYGNAIPTYSGTFATISHTFMDAQPADGIDAAKNLWKINLPDGEENAGKLPCGIYFVIDEAIDPPGTGQLTQDNAVINNRYGHAGPESVSYYPSEAWNVSPFPQPWFNNERIGPGGSWGVSTTTPGLWSGITAAVQDLKVVRCEQMPWNYARTKKAADGSYYSENPMLLGNGNPDNLAASNSYDQAKTVENQMEPARWAAQKWFTAGFVIVDAAGYGFFKCVTAGYSGLSEPVWNLALDAVTGETHDTPPAGGQNAWAEWQCVRLFRPADTWVASKTWKIGETCADANGNTQTVISGWQAFQAWSVGQFITDTNNNTQQVITAGLSGGGAPAWAAALNATTADGSVVWKLVLLGSSSLSGTTEPAWGKNLGSVKQDGTVFWQLTSAVKTIEPAQHRANPVPRYPVYWQDESLAWLKPPVTNQESEKTIWGCGNQWCKSSYIDIFGQTIYEGGFQEKFTYGSPASTIGNQAYGWWIYSVAINRLQKYPANTSDSDTGKNTGAGDSAVGAGNTETGAGQTGNRQPVAVTIGCLRNGTFVAFGTFQTGQKINVLWPIFTSDALVYQCAERVDVQAVAIGLGANGVQTGYGVTDPAAAALVTDTIKLLQFVK
jgi:hypothetical protein